MVEGNALTDEDAGAGVAAVAASALPVSPVGGDEKTDSRCSWKEVPMDRVWARCVYVAQRL